MSYPMLSIEEFDELFLSSTSKGNAKKFISRNRMYFAKCNSRLQFGDAFDAYSEIIASNVEQILGIQAVKYFPAYMNGEFVCYSRNFCGPDEIFITYETWVQSENRKMEVAQTATDRYFSVLETYYELTGIDATTYIDTMLCLDYLICNCDRHFNNFGIVKNLITGEFRLPPVFDNGMCLGSLGGYLRSPADYARVAESKPFSYSFDTQLDLVLRKPFDIPESLNRQAVFASLEDGLDPDFVMGLLELRLEVLKSKFKEV